MADAFETVILRLAGQAGPGETIGPADVAREVAQEIGVEWEQLLRAVRRAAVKLALDGKAIILLKGEAVDPENFRGIYRIAGSDHFTPRNVAPHHSARPAPLAPARDYRPEPRPYTPPAPPAPKLVATPPPLLRVVQPPMVLPAPVPQAEPQATDDQPEELSFEQEIEREFSIAFAPAPAPVEAEAEIEAEADAEDAPAASIDEGTPVTRFEYAAPVHADDDADFLDETQPLETPEDDEAPSPLPPLPFSLRFDDEDEEGFDEDAGRAPQSATLDDIASQLERYLAAELNNPSRGNAEIGDDIVGLPGEQDK